jgi:2-polyprenyl-3-methyl-5-hydroxy-6-metoxy-1,4-benzoquinol methylase
MTHATPFDLDELASAVRYQQWMLAAVRPYLGDRVLEVGAGSGNMSRWLRPRDRLILTEPDPALAERLADAAAAHVAPPADGIAIARFDPVTDDAGRFASERIDTIVSFNVLEHIERDDVALRTLAAMLELGASSRVVTRSFKPLGLPGWILAGRVLRQRRISPGQVRLSEALVPVYRWADHTVVGRFGLRYGQSLIGVIELPPHG